GNIALDGKFVPLLGMADIVDRDVIMLAPEEWDSSKFFAAPEQVAGRGLALTLGHDPMLDANLIAAMRIGPPRDVAGSQNRWLARFQIGVHAHPAIHGKSGSLGEREPRANADPGDHKISLERAAAFELHLSAVNGGRHV